MKNGIIEKKVDEQGRIVLPAEWRKKSLKEKKVLMMIQNNQIFLIPKEEKSLKSFYKKAKKSEIDPFKDYEKALKEASMK